MWFIYVEGVVESEANATEDASDEEDDDNEDDDNEEDDDKDDRQIIDSYGHVIPDGCSYVKGKYLEKDTDTRKG